MIGGADQASGIVAAIRRVLPKNKFARGVSIIAGGTAGAQLLAVLASPLLTRLYSPEDFGLFAVFASMLAVAAVNASLRYESAIMLPESDSEAANVVVLSLSVVVIISSLVAIVVGIFPNQLATLLNAPRLAPYLWLLPLGILLQGIYQVFANWGIRMKAFGALAKTKLTQVFALLLVQLAGFSFGPLALLFGQVAGQAAGGTSLGAIALKSPAFKQVSLRGVRATASRYRHFPLFASWSGLFNTISMQLPPLLFATQFGTTAVGYYAIAYRVLGMPISMVGTAIGNVFLSDAAEAHRGGRLGPLVAKVHEKLAHIAMIPTLIVMVAGPALFALVFGPSWRPSGELARWMAPWLYFVFITSPLSTLFLIMEKQVQGMIFQGSMLVFRVVAIYIGAKIGGIVVATAIFSITSAIFWVGFLAWIIRKSGNNWNALVGPTMSALMWSALIVLPLLLVVWNAPGSPAWLVAALVITSLLTAYRYFKVFRKAY